MPIAAAGSGRTGSFRLEPETGIDIADGRMVASSADAWLKLVPARALTSRRWVRIRYSASFFDDPVRPLIRFTTSDGKHSVQPMNGPVLGTGEWIGRVPDKTTSVSIAPVKMAGSFDFQLDSIESVTRRSLIQRGLIYDRRSLLLSVGAKIIDAQEERWETLKFAASATPFARYSLWHKRLARPFDIGGLDRPRSDWDSGPAIQVLLDLRSGSVERLKATIASLREQAYRRWTLHGLQSSKTPSALLSAFRNESAGDPRLREIATDTDFFSCQGEENAWVTVVRLGDLIPDYAFAVLAETLARNPNVSVVYGDEDAIAADGKLHTPLFKPDWSPIFFDGWPYLGRLTCIRHQNLAACGLRTAGDFTHRENQVVKQVISSVLKEEIFHIRRILYRRHSEINQRENAAADIVRKPLAVTTLEAWPEVTIVIPTRDRADLLAQCVKGLREKTDYPSFRVVLVDNGSVKADARALLQELGALPQFTVLQRPGKFNFSALCNDGAAVAKTPILVFLNNDIVVFESNWLRELVRWAIRPEIGVAGAKLLFPDNSIEHAGVVLGHGGIAGHIYPGQPAAEPGHMHELTVPHEVLAVTGACIAIQRDKFDAVGGFDAENLPVDLNDIDLCLRLAECGWKSVWTPASVLYHLQSASRGFHFKPFKVYQKERDYFQNRWAHAIRDDPYFHPALSLFSHNPALA